VLVGVGAETAANVSLIKRDAMKAN
jgi:hypothetical protein